MGLLKKFDLFRSINREQKEGTILGAILTFVCIVLMMIFFSRELKEYHQEKLTTKLYVLSLSNAVIQVEFDIDVFHMQCEHLLVSEDHAYEDMELTRTPYQEQGCNLRGRYYMQPMDNHLTIKPDMQSTFADLMSAGDSQNKHIDFSHRINRFQFGRSTSGLTQLSSSYPDLVRVNPLDGHEFSAKNENEGHSVFLYEMNIVGAKVNGYQEIIYHHSSNTINSMSIQPAINFIHDFSAIGVAYDERRGKNFLEFLTYLFAIVGGILAIVKFLNGIVQACLSRRKVQSADSIMEMS
jgi:Ca2+/Na+ antiporter